MKQTEMSRCSPSKTCPQECECARRTWLGNGSIDGSVIHVRGFASCPLFVDRRGDALNRAPVRAYSEQEIA